MQIPLPLVIQGGMGAGVSNWRLANSVSSMGQLGVVSGAGLDQILARRLQDGDPEGHVRRALEHLPFPRMRRRILARFFIPGGKKAGVRYRISSVHRFEPHRFAQEMCIAANFVEIYLAREGHGNPVGINYLEKIQLPLLPSLFGAMVAGVDVVLMGAGIPMEVPGALDALAALRPASYPVRVTGAERGAVYRTVFDPTAFLEEPGIPGPLRRPDFVPVVASDILASLLVRRANGAVDGFIIEGPTAGGHNAPPRGHTPLDEQGQPVYGPRDTVDLAAIRELGLPFWLAGSYGSRERLAEARSLGAAGIQVGTAFALCVESGLEPDLRRSLVHRVLAGEMTVFTDPAASPTGFPFKVARHPGTLSEESVYRKRMRVCNLGFLRETYLREDGRIGYRCPAEPEADYVAKGGNPEEAVGRRCLCNALLANIGYPQVLPNGELELPLVTLGDDVAELRRFKLPGDEEYTAAHVLRVLLEA